MLSKEEDFYFKNKEELRIDRLNKDEASDYLHLFNRMCTVLGYSLILTTAVGGYILIIGYPIIADSTYSNGIPKVNIYKEYMIHLLPVIGIWLPTFLSNGTYINYICGNGLKKIVFGVRYRLFKGVLLCCFLGALLVLLCSYLVASGVNVYLVEAITLFLIIVINMSTWMNFTKFAQKKVKSLISEEKREFLNRRKTLKVIVKQKGGISNSFYFLAADAFIFLFCVYYIYFTITIYRNCSNVVKGIIVLIIHPLVVEIVLTVLRFGFGSSGSVDATFYQHLNTSPIEICMNLFRRFLFNDTSSMNVMIIFIFLNGLEEIFARSYMEQREVFIRNLVGAKKLTKVELISKRKLYSHLMTSRSIFEISSILIVPLMIVVFSDNRFTFDLGYNGVSSINVNYSLFSMTTAQLVIELLTIFICTVIEMKQNIPNSDFFLHLRSGAVLFSHFTQFACLSQWVLHNFKTIPNDYLCSDKNDPCTCPSFSVYIELCQVMKNTNGSVDITSIIDSSNMSSLSTLDKIPAFGCIVGILCVMIVSYLIIRRNNRGKRRLARAAAEEKVKERENKKNISDEATVSLMERSSLQKSIATIEGLCFGVSPTQAKLLQNIIEVLKKQSKSHNNVVDVENVLKDSSEDKMVEGWLKGQLMSSNDYYDMKSKTKLRSKRIPLSDQSRFNENDNVDVTKRRKSLEKGFNENRSNNSFIIISKLQNEEPLDYLSWDFNVFSIKNKSPQSFLAWQCLSKLGLIDELKLPKLQLSNILLFVEEHYSLVNYDSFSAYSDINNNTIQMVNDEKRETKIENQYHNNMHGADVFQAVLYFSTIYKDIGSHYSSFDLLAVLFAAYIHDFNHPGLNSTYMISDWPSSGISSTFGSESPLEKHHLAMAFNLMRNKEHYNFLLNCSFTELNMFRRLVTECVIATDLAKSMSWISTSRIAFQDWMRNNKFIPMNVNMDVSNPVEVVVDENLKLEREKKNLEYKILLMQLSIKCADVGHPARPLDQHLAWSNKIREEFFSQGDKERSRGMTVSPLCDRNVSASSYPQGQIGFINFVSKPVFTMLNDVCSSVISDDEKPWLKYMNSNIQYWEEKKKEATG